MPNQDFVTSGGDLCCVVFFQEKNNTKENLTVDSKTLPEVEDKKKNTATTDNTINNNTKLSSGLNDHCVNSTKKLHQSSIKESNSPER